MTVSFFYIDEAGFELQIGLGTTTTIQENAQIQVTLTHPIHAHDDILKRLAQNEASVLKNLRVKPYISRTYLDYFSRSEPDG